MYVVIAFRDETIMTVQGPYENSTEARKQAAILSENRSFTCVETHKVVKGWE